MTEQELKKRRELQKFAEEIDFACVNLPYEDRYEIAKALTILGYQRIPEDSMVIKKSKLDLLVAQSERIIIDKDGNFINYAMYEGDKVLSKAEYRDYVSHEIAERIFHELMMKISFDGHTLGVWKHDVLELAKKYGVNII